MSYFGSQELNELVSLHDTERKRERQRCKALVRLAAEGEGINKLMNNRHSIIKTEESLFSH